MRDRAKWDAWKVVEGLQNPLDKSFFYIYIYITCWTKFISYLILVKLTGKEVKGGGYE